MSFRTKAASFAIAAALSIVGPTLGAQRSTNHNVSSVNQELDELRAAVGELQHASRNVLFVQQDKVVAFNPATGIGAQTGTVSGRIRGTSIVNFRFEITNFPNFTFDNRAGITDLDGDQIIFKNVGNGRFVFPALADPTIPTPVTPPFQVFGAGLPFPLFGLGGPLTGTYEVVATSGKFSRRFALGQVFRYRAIAYNPSVAPTDPPTDLGTFGSVYVEVYTR